MADKAISPAMALAKGYYDQEYSCAESVWLALNADLAPEQLDFGNRLAVGFAGGLGGGSLCGAISGAVLALGRRYGRDRGMPRPEELKRLTKLLHARVLARLGSVDCRDLRPEDNPRTVCGEIVVAVTEIAEELIKTGAPEEPGCTA